MRNSHVAYGARLCAGQRGTSRSSPQRRDALRLVFDTAALRKRFMERENRPPALAVLECGGKSARHRFRTSLDFQTAIDASKRSDSDEMN